jgi:hypothetical protein
LPWHADQSVASTITESYFYDAERALTAVDKTGLAPEQPALSSHFTNVAVGIRGVKIIFDTDIADDFRFRAGNTEDMSIWGAPASPTVTIENNREATITWSSGAVKNGWLEVTYVPANLVRYFGNLVGDANSNGSVTPIDALLIINYLNSGSETFVDGYDINQDGVVSPQDALIVIGILNQSEGNAPTLVSGPFYPGDGQPVERYPVDTTPFSITVPTGPSMILKQDNLSSYNRRLSDLALVAGQENAYELVMVPKRDPVEPDPVILLPRTGQKKCFDAAGGEIACDGTGQDGEFQAGLLIPSPRFSVTYCDASGLCADQGQDCDADAATDAVKDHLTGLTWARVDIYQKKWTEALTAAGASRLCGYSDWRVPNVLELESLFEAGETYPAAALNGQGFSIIHFNRYWTSTWLTDQDGNNLAWSIVYDGYIGPHFRSGYNDVILVRDETALPAQIRKTGQMQSVASGDDGALQKGTVWPDPRFTDYGDGTVRDDLTGLFWLKDANCIMSSYPGFDSDGKVDWIKALNFIVGVNNGDYGACGAGFTDWRLPNRNELYSLIDFSKTAPALPKGHPFINVLPWRYWSSSTRQETPREAWVVNLFAGDIFSDYKSGGQSGVWPVRGGMPSVTGDVDGSRFVDLADAILAMKVLSMAATSEKIDKKADVNDDGKIGLAETIYILQTVAEIR